MIAVLSWTGSLPTGAQPQEDPGLPVFLAAAEAVANKGEGQRLSVDPRPFRISTRAVFPDTSSYVTIEGADLRARTDALSDRGIEAAPALPVLRACDGLMTPPGMKDTTGCPALPETRVGFDVGRQTEAGTWELRKIEIYYGPSGRSATTLVVTVASVGGSWEVVSEVALVYFD